MFVWLIDQYTIESRVRNVLKIIFWCFEAGQKEGRRWRNTIAVVVYIIVVVYILHVVVYIVVVVVVVVYIVVYMWVVVVYIASTIFISIAL